MPPVVDLSALATAHGVRGTVPDQLDEDALLALGRAFGEAVARRAPGAEEPPRVVLGRDVRESSPALAAAFSAGLATSAVRVVDLGLASTETLCYASSWLAAPAAMVTAGHCSARHNGLKLWWSPAAPVGPRAGLREICARAAELRGTGSQRAASPGTGSAVTPAQATGEVRADDVLAGYAAHLRALVDLAGIRPLRVVVDAGSGMAGLTVPSVLGDGAVPAVELVPVFFDLDGSFPFHDADPSAPVNLLDLQTAVVANDADLGLAFDGDADRCFVVDERGAPVSASAVMVLVGLQLLERARGDERAVTILHTETMSRAVPEILGGSGARTVVLRASGEEVGAALERADAVLAAAPHGRFYYRDFFGADSALLTALHVVAAVGSQALSLSELVEIVEPYSGSGALASVVADPDAALERVIEAYVTQQGAGPVSVDESDGLLVSHWDEQPRWWFHLRVEPGARGTSGARGPGGGTVVLVVEAADEDIMDKVRDDVLALVRELDPAAEDEEETDD